MPSGAKKRKAAARKAKQGSHSHATAADCEQDDSGKQMERPTSERMLAPEEQTNGQISEPIKTPQHHQEVSGAPMEYKASQRPQQSSITQVNAQTGFKEAKSQPLEVSLPDMKLLPEGQEAAENQLTPKRIHSHTCALGTCETDHVPKNGFREREIYVNTLISDQVTLIQLDQMEGTCGPSVGAGASLEDINRGMAFTSALASRDDDAVPRELPSTSALASTPALASRDDDAVPTTGACRNSVLSVSSLDNDIDPCWRENGWIEKTPNCHTSTNHESNGTRDQTLQSRGKDNCKPACQSDILPASSLPIVMLLNDEEDICVKGTLLEQLRLHNVAHVDQEAMGEQTLKTKWWGCCGIFELLLQKS